MPHNPEIRPAWMVQLGISIYDFLASRSILPKSNLVDLKTHTLGQPLQDKYKQAFIYSDAWVDDARLVVLNAIDAKNRGATILTRTECREITMQDGAWLARLTNQFSKDRVVKVKPLINAAGPWADRLLKKVHLRSSQKFASKKLRLVKGSHIVIPKCFDHDHAYIFQNPDKRIMFAIPYESKFTLIGTTDTDFIGDPATANISDEETTYLCSHANNYFKKEISSDQVLWHYSGVRPPIDDGKEIPSNASRDYAIEIAQIESAPFINVWGGKITTYRKLSEDVANYACESLQARRGIWTKGVQLPGGNLPDLGNTDSTPMQLFERYYQYVQFKYPWLPTNVLHRWGKNYLRHWMLHAFKYRR